MDQLFYQVLAFVGFTHPLHPVLITMVVGPVITSFLFVSFALFLRKPDYFKTARQLTVVAFIFWFPTVAVGLMDWVHFYKGSTEMTEISAKLILAGLLFVTLLGNILLFKKGQEKPVYPLVLTFLATLLVGGLGFFGGEIVFGSSAKPQAVATGIAPVAQDGGKSLEQEGYKLTWKIHDGKIDVSVSYATDGWVGVGFGKTGTMEGSHIILGFVLDGKATVVDQFGNARDRHADQATVGGKDSLSATGGTFENGVTTIKFTMPLNTGNPRDPVLSEGETYKILLANGGEGAADLTSYHERSGRLVLDVTL